ncbi:MAG: hypothetical protein KH138_12150, partial [Firmicutes bacterium]|nr:hypothetical protein [Bacillota bacterium]
KGLAACNSQTANPFGCLNNFYFRILSNFLGSLQARLAAGFSRPPPSFRQNPRRIRRFPPLTAGKSMVE